MFATATTGGARKPPGPIPQNTILNVVNKTTGASRKLNCHHKLPDFDNSQV